MEEEGFDEVKEKVFDEVKEKVFDEVEEKGRKEGCNEMEEGRKG